MAGGRDVFEVEGILDQRMRRGREEFLIRWKGFDEDEDTWEPEKNLFGCDEILEEWKRRWLAAQTPRRTKIVKPIFKPPPTPTSTRKRTVKKVEEKVVTKVETPKRTPRKAAPTPKAKVPVITVSESEEETVVVKVTQKTTNNSATTHAEKKEEVVKVAENIGQKSVSTLVGKQLLSAQTVAAQEQKIAETTPSRRTRVTTMTESDNESDQDLKRSALRSRDLTRQVFSASRTASTVTTRQERSEVSERKTVVTRAAAKQEGLSTHVETPMSSKLTRASLNSVRDGRVGVSPLFAGARSRVAVRVGKVRSMLTCHNFLNLVFVVCMGAVFYTLFFYRK